MKTFWTKKNIAIVLAVLLVAAAGRCALRGGEPRRGL